jgi:cytoskeletal protein CcmA (bactofilin family)
MQINKRHLSVTVALALLLIPVVAFAAVIRTDSNLPQGEVVNGNLYLTGSAPVIAGSVHGDLLAAGGTVVMTGNVSQDFLIAAGNIIVSGPVGGDLRAFGGNIYIDAPVQGEVFTAGGDVKIGANAVITGDLVVYGGNVVINPAAKIYGVKKISSSADLEKEMKAKGNELPSFLQTAFLLGQLMSLLGLLLVAALMFGFFPNVTNRVATKSLEHGFVWKNLGLGMLVLLAAPLAAIICLITGFGALLGGILFFMFMVYILFGIAFSGITFGLWLYKITKKDKKPQLKWGTLILGVVLLHVISLIPIFGWLAALVFILLTWGGALRLKMEIIKQIK